MTFRECAISATLEASVGPRVIDLKLCIDSLVLVQSGGVGECRSGNCAKKKKKKKSARRDKCSFLLHQLHPFVSFNLCVRVTQLSDTA